MEPSQEFKIVTLGEGRVGKTSLTLKAARGQFHEDERSTVNANFLQKDITFQGNQIRLHLWDTAGQERFRALAPNYYRGAKGAIVVYDITDKSSFDRVVSWVKELSMQADKDICIVIAGNKCDREKERQISKAEAMEYARKVGVLHFDTSAKTGMGVEEIFSELGRLVYEVQMKKNPGTGERGYKSRKGKKIIIKKEEEVQKKKDCC
ncbi:unnamed protein product [Blepharisma stoltei]|uniref:Ras-related protein Rab-21 n=1 Tax=Blepharisma stoltei TaxID=1481888 RepID=A0AAU9J5L0_9CILI|nr:unnamed protein product [Blepharisma stoltei]